MAASSHDQSRSIRELLCDLQVATHAVPSMSGASPGIIVMGSHRLEPITMSVGVRWRRGQRRITGDWE